MARARLIYNPTSGREGVRRHLHEILDILETHGIETTTYQTKAVGEAIKAAEEAGRKGYDIVIAAGGDGTLNEVVNGLGRLEIRPKLGLIPAGTTNDFARALGIPKDFKKAAKIIGEQKSLPIDIGKYNDKFFINIAAGGKITEITYEVPSKLKTVLGHLAYYVRGIEKLPFVKPIDVTFEIDNKKYSENAMLFLIANSNSVGGFEKLAPYADLSDGLFDVIILKKTNLGEFVRLATLALKGDHISDPNIIHIHAKKVKVFSNSIQPVLVNLDGELGGELPGEFEIMPHHIEVFINQSTKL